MGRPREVELLKLLFLYLVETDGFTLFNGVIGCIFVKKIGVALALLLPSLAGIEGFTCFGSMNDCTFVKKIGVIMDEMSLAGRLVRVLRLI